MKKTSVKQAKNRRGRLFVPGKSGNPAGRPKGRSISDSMKELLDEDVVKVRIDLPGKKKIFEYRLDQKIKDAIAGIIIVKALCGNLQAIEIILDRCEGKVTLPVELPQPTDIFISIENDDGTLADVPGQPNEKKC